MHGSGDAPRPAFEATMPFALATIGTGGTCRVNTNISGWMVFIVFMTLKFTRSAFSHTWSEVHTVVNTFQTTVHPHK